MATHLERIEANERSRRQVFDLVVVQPKVVQVSGATEHVGRNLGEAVPVQREQVEVSQVSEPLGPQEAQLVVADVYLLQIAVAIEHVFA